MIGVENSRSLYPYGYHFSFC